MDKETIIPRSTINIHLTMMPIEELENIEKKTHIQEPGLPSSSRRQNGNRRRWKAMESPRLKREPPLVQALHFLSVIREPFSLIN
jgi:hypothetical protein